jgi:hypothetical protein
MVTTVVEAELSTEVWTAVDAAFLIVQKPRLTFRFLSLTRKSEKAED